MSDEAFAALVADIRENGLREAIVLYEGKVLDGRNRYRACTEVGIEPITKQWDQRGTALSYVISKNLHRRHLSESQRAMVAAKIANQPVGGGFRGNQYVSAKAPIGAPPKCPGIDGVSRASASKLLNVGSTSVDRAKRVQDRGIKELQQAVESGDVSLWVADEIARQPQEEQRVIVSRGEKAISEAAKAIRAAAPARKRAQDRRCREISSWGLSLALA
jgi:hypothetical protein